MGFNCGIIGLPNVGKSTIFNALSGAGAQMANYPFCTIEPNKGIVPVPDKRLEEISALLNKKNPIPTRIEFVDVAGLVKGASKGEGLGNKFLGHIRNVDAIIHVVRCFLNEDVVHVTGKVSPVNDIEIINTELLLADIEVLSRAADKEQKLIRSGEKKAKSRHELIEHLIDQLNSGTGLRSMALKEEEQHIVDELGLITCKPVLYLANTDERQNAENELKKIEDLAGREGAEFMAITGNVEEEISELPAEEKMEYLNAMGLQESGLDRLIIKAYALLDLITYYTSATDLQAWTVKKDTPAHTAAGKIHTDFERGFIRAEVMHYKDLLQHKTEHAVKEHGLLRSEGKDYIVQDGDIIRYLFNV